MQQTLGDQPVPQSRTSLSAREGPQLGPIPLFDYHLTILTDSYLNFFQERKRIEENYVDSLINLHKKAKAADSLFDDRSELSTTRGAWSEVRENIEREAQTRQAFLNTLTLDVVNILTDLKDTQDRTRKRIKEDLRESSIAYNEYAENTLPKLKRTYLRKCQDVEDFKAAQSQAPRQDGGHQQSQSLEHNSAPLTNSRSNPSLPSKPVVTSPHPLRPLDRRPSGSMPTTRNRSPSTNTAFSDLASHGKGKLNQLITFLDKSGNVKDGGSALRAVRSKREAEEADKEYRKGVHWLETLRLRRTKILQAGYNSLERFVHESSTTVKKVLEQYTDNMTATTTTQTHLSAHLRSTVDRISPSKDLHALSQAIPRSLASAIPQPVLYWNYNVGECSDLIFGVSLVDYATARGLAEGEVPKIVRICIQEVDSRGLENEGIYRVSGRHAIVQELQHKIERNEATFEFNHSTDDVFAVSSLLKLYLRELPEPVFRYSLQDRLQHTEDLAEHQSNNFVLLRSKMRRLPPVHQATLKAILEHLARIAARSEKNKMDVKNLAIVFGGVIFGEDDLPKGGDLLSMQCWKDTLMEDLITNAAVLFDDRAPAAASPPLPPAPAGQPTPNYTYGSAHTKVASVPGPLQTPGRQQLQISPSEDFTPRLPPRPTNSIHPSSRTNPTSPTKTSTEVPPVLPARPGQAGPSKQTASVKPAPPIPKPTIPLSPESVPPPSTSSTSTLVTTQEENERAPVLEEHRDNTSVLTPTSPARAPRSPQTPKSTMPPWPASAASVSAHTDEDESSPSPTSPSVPGGFPS